MRVFKNQSVILEHEADTVVEERLGITTGVANPFNHMSRSSKIGSAALNRDAPAMMIAAGLALRRFD